MRNAWAKKIRRDKHYNALRERLVATQFLGREPEEYELEQLPNGNKSTDMSEAEIQLCMTRGDLASASLGLLPQCLMNFQRIGVYTMECVAYDNDFQRQVAGK